MVVIFEDETFENYYPLTLTKAVFELKCGASALFEKILRALNPQEFCFFARDYLAPALRKRLPADTNNLELLEGKDALLVNGRWLWTGSPVSDSGEEEAGISAETGDILYVRAKRKTVSECLREDFQSFLREAVSRLKTKNISGETLICYPWDLISNNAGAIVRDFNYAGKSGLHCRFPSLSSITGDESKLYAAPGAVIHPNVAIDVTNGPVTIRENVTVYPHTWIQGPCYIGEDTEIYGAKVREGMSIGPCCRIGGEVEESVMHGYTNKYHDGFLGHSYLGEFINLGAGTSNSDVKNDYSSVQVHIKGDFIDTRRMKVGSLIGDHTKTSIGTLFNTGSSIGALSIILGGDGILPKFIPSFSWYINRRATKGFGFGKLVEAAKAQMKRRGKELSEEEMNVLIKAHEITKPQRDFIIKRDRRS